jgi:aminopeptidase
VCSTVRDRSGEIGKLAELYVGLGANVQPGEIVGITGYLGQEAMVRALARAAYERGAKWVDVFWWDPWVKRARLEHAAEDTLDYVPPWMGQRMRWLGEEHAARISLTGPNLKANAGLDPARTGKDTLPYLPEVPIVINQQTTSWTVGPYPIPEWAELVHPGLAPDAALDKLWDEVIHVLRLDEPDPIEAWSSRMQAIARAAGELTARRFDAIHLVGPGTDLTVGLLPTSTWIGADFQTRDGKTHYPNLPTEEVFTAPDPTRVDGHVTATKPLEFHGSSIDGIRVAFEGGRAVKIDADKGADALRGIASRDEGAARLGELALVDGEGRIGPLGTVFHETLLDENSASHIALGNAYSFTVEPEDAPRINTSAIHADFMIGSDEIDVDGITRDGERVPVLRGGTWQI